MNINAAQECFFVLLATRATITLSGEDRTAFIQNLITNDIDLLKTQDCIYACLLTPQGKFLYDFFITDTNDTLILECEGGDRLSSLTKMLNMYKLRADVSINSQDNIPVYITMGNAPHGHKDPRHGNIGYRSFSKPKNIPQKDFKEWDKLRISLCIPDGSRDLIPNKSTMDEGRMDQINAVSYDKGCYIGQELTARMYYRGLGKKHLRTITPTDITAAELPQCDEAIIKDGKNIGIMRSSCDNIGLAILKDE
ncbi:MAG: YgfZ/GcvT domain-containing protein [Alphaproteobacteria bacterium]